LIAIDLADFLIYIQKAISYLMIEYQLQLILKVSYHFLPFQTSFFRKLFFNS